MLNFLKQNKAPKDVKTLRSDLLDFIKDQLKKAEGEGADIKGMHLYISCDAQQKFIYDSAVYINTPEQFKEEVQKIADDFDISLPAGWQMQIICDDAVPPEAIQSSALDAAFVYIYEAKANYKKRSRCIFKSVEWRSRANCLLA